MFTYVLIHGAWHGGWCWSKLESHLKVDKHHIIIPTLPFLSDSISLETHIETVIQTIKSNKYNNLVLIGHSYAGMLLAPVAECFHKHVRGLIYLDAVVPEKGQSFYNVFRNNNENYLQYMQEDILQQKLIDPPHPNEFGVTQDEDVKWMISNLRPHPLKTFCDPILHSINKINEYPKLYITCLKNNVDVFIKQKSKLSCKDGWWFQDIEESHDVMVTNPEMLSRLIKNFSYQIIQ